MQNFLTPVPNADPNDDRLAAGGSNTLLTEGDNEEPGSWAAGLGGDPDPRWEPLEVFDGPADHA